MDRDLQRRAQNHPPSLPPLFCPSSPACMFMCTCLHVFFLCVCVYVFYVRLSVTLSTTIRVTVCAKCDPRRGAESHGPRTVTPTAGPRTTLQHCLLSSCPLPSHSLPMSLHVTYTSTARIQSLPPPGRQTPGYRGTLDRRPRHSNVQHANKSPLPPPPPPLGATLRVTVLGP